MACVRKRRGKWVVDWRDYLGVRRWLSFEAEDVLADEVKERRQAAPPVVDPNITLIDWSQRWLDQVPVNLAQHRRVLS